uniref:Uncharacterized protein n=1 Tax=Anguilla anguilla TaxID=7936 RepID=A0A0E9PZN2_ANGAN
MCLFLSFTFLYENKLGYFNSSVQV